MGYKYKRFELPRPKRDIHLDQSTTTATKKKRDTPLSLTDLARKKKRRIDKDRNKGKVVIREHVLY